MKRCGKSNFLRWGYYLLWILVLEIFSACENEDCPNKEVIGSIQIRETSKGFLPMAQAGEAIFVDSLQNKMIFTTTGLQMKPAEVYVEEICEGDQGLFGSSSARVLTSEKWSLNFTSLDNGLFSTIEYEINILNENFPSPDTALVEQLDIRLRNSNDNIGIYTLASDRGYNDSSFVMVDRRDIRLLDKEFKNVQYAVRNETELYYLPGRGVVAFRLQNGRYWVLDELNTL